MEVYILKVSHEYFAYDWRGAAVRFSDPAIWSLITFKHLTLANLYNNYDNVRGGNILHNPGAYLEGGRTGAPPLPLNSAGIMHSRENH